MSPWNLAKTLIARGLMRMSWTTVERTRVVTETASQSEKRASVRVCDWVTNRTGSRTANRHKIRVQRTVKAREKLLNLDIRQRPSSMRATLIHPTKADEVGLSVLTRLVATTKHEKNTIVNANLVLKR
jgi:hypothetical protein